MGCSVKKHFKSSENRKTLKHTSEALIGAHGTQFKRSEGQHPEQRQGHDLRQSFSPGFVSSLIFSGLLLCVWVVGGMVVASVCLVLAFAGRKGHMPRVPMQMFFFELHFFHQFPPCPHPVGLCVPLGTSLALSRGVKVWRGHLKKERGRVEWRHVTMLERAVFVKQAKIPTLEFFAKSAIFSSLCPF